MTDQPLMEPDALDELIRAYEFQYADVSALWRTLETKAQGVVALTGVFVGIAFVIADKLRPLSTCLRTGLVIAVSCFTLATGLAVVSLIVRQLPAPPAGNDLGQLLRDYLGGDLTLARTLNLRRDYLRLWSRSIGERVHANNCKAGWLKAAQLMGLAGVVTMAIVTASAIIQMQ